MAAANLDLAAFLLCCVNLKPLDHGVTELPVVKYYAPQSAPGLACSRESITSDISKHLPFTQAETNSNAAR